MAEFDTQLHQDRERLESTTRAASNTTEADAPKPTGRALTPPGTRQHSRVCGCSTCAWPGSMAPGIVTNGLPRVEGRREYRVRLARLRREALASYVQQTPEPGAI